MTKKSIIFLYFVFNYLIESTKSNDFRPKNLLFTADFKDSEEFIFSAKDDYIRLSVAKDRSILEGRRSFPKCFAVGCTKTALICEQKGGRMITTFRSVNDTRQAYFKSTLVAEDMVVTVNCREAHYACCFEGPKKLNAVAMPPVRPTVPVANSGIWPNYNPIQKPHPYIYKPAPPTFLLTPLKYFPHLKPDSILKTPLITQTAKYTENPCPSPVTEPTPPLELAYVRPMPTVKPTVKPTTASYPVTGVVPPKTMAPTQYSQPIDYSGKSIRVLPTRFRSNAIIHKIHEYSSKTRLGSEHSEPAPPKHQQKAQVSVELPAAQFTQIEIEEQLAQVPGIPQHQEHTKLEHPVHYEQATTPQRTHHHHSTTPVPTTTDSKSPLSTPSPQSDSNKPVKVYLFSNICIGFLGGAGFVDCNG